ncbi:MAG: DUF6056 family protein [Vicingaceae bacterium]|nr:DUF6056 family protein [Vicingaceae bacterium]
MQNKTSYLITTQAILFVVFLFSCFFFNRFAVDDYYFIGEINSKSFSEIYKNLYINWHGRWTSNFILLSFIKFYNIPFFLFLFNCLSTLLLYLGVHKLLKNTSEKLKFEINFSTLKTYALIFLSVFFFSTVNPNETWFWYTGSAVYLWSIIAFIFSLTLLINTKNKLHHYLLFVLSFIYIGGANEPLSLFIIIGLIFLLIKGLKKNLTLLGLAVILISFSINYLSSGTIHRDEITPSLGLLDSLLYSGYGTIKYLFFEFYSTFLVAIILAIPFYFLGSTCKTNFKWFNPIKHLLYACLSIGLFTFINNFMAVFALGGLAPDRAIISSSFIICITIVGYLFLLGSSEKVKITQFAPILAITILILLTVNSIIIHNKYANHVDKRILYILDSDEEIIKVRALPKSGYLYNTEITKDVKHFSNQHLKNGLGINNDVALETAIEPALD